MNIMYGGTKEEMERLVKDAAKIDKSFKYNTKTVIKNKKAVTELDMSYADIVRAIHIVQTNMGITGTTAEEASKTISGSIGMLKSAWANLITGMGEGNEKKLDKLVNDVVDAAKIALNNVLPVAEKAAYGILHLVEAAVPVIVKEIPKIASSIVKQLPKIASSIVKQLPKIASSIVKQLPKIYSAINNSIRNDLIPGVAKLIGGIFGLGKTRVNVLTRQLRKIYGEVKEIVKQITDIVTRLWKRVLQPILKDIISFVQRKVLPAVTGTLKSMTAAWEKIEPSISTLFMAIKGLWDDVLFPVLKNIFGFVSDGSSGVIDTVTYVVKAVIEWVARLVNNIKNFFTREAPEPLKQFYGWIHNTLLPFIQEAIKWIVDHIDLILPIVEGVVAGIVALSIGKKIAGIMGAVSKLFSVIMAHPFVIVIGAIVTLVAYLVHLYKTNEEARDKINAAFDAIKGFWENTLKPAFEAIYTYVVETLIPTVIDWFENQFKPAVERTFTAIEGFWNDTLKPALEAIYSYVVETLIPTLIDWWENHLKPSIEGVFTAIAGFWENTLKPALVALYDYVYRDLIPTLIVWWEYHLQPAIEGVFNAIAGFWNDILKPALEAIYTYVVTDLIPTLIVWWEYKLQPVIEAVFTAIKTFWEETAKPALNAFWEFVRDNVVPIIQTLGEKFQTVMDTYLKPVWTWVSETFIAVWGDLQTAIQGIITFITTGEFPDSWKKAWEGIVAAVSTPFNSLGEILKVPINAVIDLLNGMIRSVRDAINTVIDFINTKLSLRIPKPVIEGNLLDGTLRIGEDKDNPIWSWSPNIGKISWDDNPIAKLAKGGVVGEGDSAWVGEYAPELLRVVGGKAMVTPMSKVPARFPGGGQEIAVPRQDNRPVNIVFELDGAQKWVYRLNKLEEQRVGLKLSKGAEY